MTVASSGDTPRCALGPSALGTAGDGSYVGSVDRSDADLTTAECWELLALARVGRLALSIRALPAILPVQYVLDGESVAISMGRNGPPAVAVHDAIVAFVVDDIDEAAGAGWLVQLQGMARLTPPADAPTDQGRVDAGQLVQVRPGTVTGHRFTFPVDRSPV